jgi:prepilin peptidase CpaA
MSNEILLHLHAAALLAGIAALIAAGVHDILTRTVPNWLSGVIAAAGLVLRGLDGALPLALLAGVMVFAGCFLLWRRGAMGGADVKLLAALALLTPPAEVPAVLMVVALAGAALALSYIFMRRLAPAASANRPKHLLARALRAETWRIRRGGPLPYAVAIAFGGAFVLLQVG